MNNRQHGMATMRIINQRHELVPIDSLHPHPQNPRQGDIGTIHESIDENGFYGTIVVQESTRRILAGNHRWKAAAQQGATEVPVTFVDVDDAAALRILLVDNRANDVASYDDTALASLLQSIIEDGGDLRGTGYDGDDLDDLLRKLHPEDFAKPPESPEKAADQFLCVVQCPNEAELQALYDELTERGMSCKLVM